MLFSLLERCRGLLTPYPFWIKDLGKCGEFLARRWYRRRGYHVVDKNWRKGKGEIDLIVANGRRLVFVEVKARSGGDASIDHVLVYDQEQRLLRLAESYMSAFPMGTMGWSFELMFIQLSVGEKPQIQVAALC